MKHSNMHDYSVTVLHTIVTALLGYLDLLVLFLGAKVDLMLFY